MLPEGHESSSRIMLSLLTDAKGDPIDASGSPVPGLVSTDPSNLTPSGLTVVAC